MKGGVVKDPPTQQNFDSISQAFPLTADKFANDSVGLSAMQWLYGGTGSPENVIAAPVGSLYLRSDGGANTTLYVKEAGAAGNTGWTAK